MVSETAGLIAETGVRASQFGVKAATGRPPVGARIKELET
jgi:hypothetical protein